MDERLFHPSKDPNSYYKIMDRRINRTGAFCYYLEWVGWYDSNLALRFLGHYRLYQLYKARYPDNNCAHPSPGHSYIVRYRENRILENTWIQIISFLTPFVQNKDQDHNADVRSINQILLHKHPETLLNFLSEAETDLEKALNTAMTRIGDPEFLSTSTPTRITMQFNQENIHNTYNSKNEFHIHPVIKDQQQPQTVKGKEEDVFSKKQVLMFFALLAEARIIEPIDWKKPNRFDPIAELMHALTGKPVSSWLEELKNYRTKDLFTTRAKGQLQELKNTLTNLAEKFRAAGFRKFADLADKKIHDLDNHSRD